MTLTPAYGRDYKSKAEVLKDLNAGKDFLGHTYNREGYINSEQLVEERVFSVQVRYKANRSVMVATFANGTWR